MRRPLARRCRIADDVAGVDAAVAAPRRLVLGAMALARPARRQMSLRAAVELMRLVRLARLGPLPSQRSCLPHRL